MHDASWYDYLIGLIFAIGLVWLLIEGLDSIAQRSTPLPEFGRRVELPIVHFVEH